MTDSWNFLCHANKVTASLPTKLLDLHISDWSLSQGCSLLALGLSVLQVSFSPSEHLAAGSHGLILWQVESTENLSVSC